MVGTPQHPPAAVARARAPEGRLRRVALATAATLVLATTACTGGSPKTSDPTAAASSLPGSALNPQPVGKIADGGELRIAVDRLGSQWNPLELGGAGSDTTMIMSALLPRLFVLGGSGQPSPNPDFLTSVTPDGNNPLTVTYTLNPQAVWGSGRHLDWTDFEATWKACNGTNEEFRCASTRGFDAITSIRQGTSPQQVVVAYRHGYPDWADTFAFLLPHEGVTDPSAFTQGWQDPSKITSWFGGPFTVEAFAPDQGVLSLVPSPTWWGDRPRLSKITFKAVPTADQPAAFVGDEVDAFDLSTDPGASSKIDPATRGEVRQAVGPGFRQLVLNTRAAPLDDAKVRLAIAQALDRQQLTAADLAGSGVSVPTMDNHLFVNTQDGYRDNASPSGADHNVDTARQTLRADGYLTGSDGYLSKAGKVLSVSFSRVEGSAVSAREAQQLQAQLKIVGIKLTTVDVPAAQFDDGSVLAEHDFQLIGLSWPGSVFPADNLQPYRTGSAADTSQFSSAGLDKLIDQIDQEPNPAQRITLINQADSLLWQGLPSIPLYQQPELTAVRTRLANFGSFGMTEYPDWTDVGYLS